MARPLRIEFEGAFYHIIQRGIERKSIFASSKDKERFLAYLNSSLLAYKAIFHSYALMNNHYHLILETPRANLSKIMHYLDTSYAAYYNKRHGRAGPLYQGRFKSVLVQEDAYLHYLSSYIHLNPVRAGITKSPEGYTHSSYNYFISNKEAPRWLNTCFILSMFNKNVSKARTLYKQFVMNNIGKEKDVINSNTRKGIILGDDDFFDKIKGHLSNRETDREIPELKCITHGPEPALEFIKDNVERHIKQDKGLCRSIGIYLSRKHTQRTLNYIASFYGNIQYTGISQVCRRMEKRIGENGKLKGLIASIEADIVSNVKT
jgi:REP element-mobilizing transposase RayT